MMVWKCVQYMVSKYIALKKKNQNQKGNSISEIIAMLMTKLLPISDPSLDLQNLD